jgi:hypothetical protein
MSEEAPFPVSETFLQPDITDVTTNTNEKIRIINLGGQFLKTAYAMETRKRLRQGLPPPQKTIVENGVQIKVIEVL